MKKRTMTLLAALLAVTGIVGFTACTAGDSNESSTDSTTESVIDSTTESVTESTTESTSELLTESESVTESESITESETESETETPSIKDELGLDVKIEDLDELMKPIFGGTTVKNETVMFLDKGDVKSLLYPIESIQSVTSYDGKTVYEEGKDYVIEDGKLKVTENSSIPCITSAKFYNYPGSIIQVNHDGKTVPLYWGEGQLMTNWQVNVNYTHSTAWEGYAQASQLDVYQNFIKKLQAGEDVTVFFYGDSITYGANASWINGYAPYQLSYPILFTQALADLFDYTVHFVDAKLTASMPTAKVPTEDYVAGDRGTITYVNTAIGGWTSADGVTNAEKFVEEKIQAHGCDLFVLGFGMNDASVAPRTTQLNCEKIVDKVLAIKPEANIVLVSTMMPNPDGLVWNGNQKLQEAALSRLADAYIDKGVACGLSRVNSVSQAMLEIKDFHDYSGNNINHPNDYFVRVYAQTLLQAIIGYENMN